MFIEHVFSFWEETYYFKFFGKCFFRNSVNLIPKLVKVTLRVHYETLDCG